MRWVFRGILPGSDAPLAVWRLPFPMRVRLGLWASFGLAHPLAGCRFGRPLGVAAPRRVGWLATHRWWPLQSLLLEGAAD